MIPSLVSEMHKEQCLVVWIVLKCIRQGIGMNCIFWSYALYNWGIVYYKIPDGLRNNDQLASFLWDKIYNICSMIRCHHLCQKCTKSSVLVVWIVLKCLRQGIGTNCIFWSYALYDWGIVYYKIPDGLRNNEQLASFLSDKIYNIAWWDAITCIGNAQRAVFSCLNSSQMPSSGHWHELYLLIIRFVWLRSSVVQNTGWIEI